MSANVDRMAAVGDAPWWVGVEGEDRGQATLLGGQAITAKEMLAAAGQDWIVQLGRLRAEIKVDGQRMTATVPNRFAVVREDTKDILGVVSGRYQPVQNHESFSFFDAVVGEGQAIYHTAGSLGKGEQVWIMAKLPYEIEVNGSDKVESYLLLTNSHDAGSAFQMLFTPVRVVCQNTLNVATGYGQNRSGYRLSHFTGISRKLSAQDAQAALGIAKECMEEFGGQAERLAQTAISDEEIKGLCQRLFPLPQLAAPRSVVDSGLLLLPEPKQEELAPDYRSTFTQRETVEELIRTGKGNAEPAVAGTRWAAFNGVAEFTDYVQGWNSKRTKSLLFGYGREIKQRAWNLLTKTS